MGLLWSSPRRGPQLKPNKISMNPSLPKGPPCPQTSQGGQKFYKCKTRASWNGYDLKEAIVVLDSSYTLKDVCEIFSIPRSSLRDHYEGRIRGGKWIQRPYSPKRKMIT